LEEPEDDLELLRLLDLYEEPDEREDDPEEELPLLLLGLYEDLEELEDDLLLLLFGL